MRHDKTGFLERGINQKFIYCKPMGCQKLNTAFFNSLEIIHPKKRVSAEKKRINYYPFGLKHKGYNNAPLTNHPYKYNGVELEESIGLNLYEMDFRQYDPAIARFTSIDPITHFFSSPYNAFDNNPVVWADPSGADAESFVTDLFNMSSSGEKWTNNNDGTFSSSNGQTADCDDCPGIQLYEIGKYNNTLPNYDYSIGSEAFQVGDYSLTPYYKDGEIVAYGAVRGDRLEFIIAAGSLGVFQKNAEIFALGANLFYINGYAPDDNTIALSQGDLGGLIGMWKEALTSPQYYLYVATILVGGANVSVNEVAVANNIRRLRIPKNARGNVTVRRLGNGNTLVEATSPAQNIPGSKAVYRKWINNKGKTIKMTKTTYAPDGSIIHVKPKF